MTKRSAMTKTLSVVVEASTAELVEQLIDQLARSSCDIVNSTEDNRAQIWINEAQEARP